MTKDKQQLYQVGIFTIVLIMGLIYKFVIFNRNSELIANNVATFTKDQVEKSQLVKLHKGGDFLILSISFAGMPTDNSAFSDRSDHYKDVVRDYICTEPVMLKYFEKYKSIEADLKSTEPQKAMAMVSLTKQQCENGI